MAASSYSVRVHVEGAEGAGHVLVPVTAVPSRVLEMPRGMGAVLAGLGLLLFAGAVSIVGAAVRESVLAPGEAPTPAGAAAPASSPRAAALFLACVLWGGKGWWDSVESRACGRGLYTPFRVRGHGAAEGGRTVLRLAIDDPRAQDWSPLMPDHGKLMHLFLLREPGLDAFAHLHPIPVPGQEQRFTAALPPLPAGTYRLYADVVHESGFPQTLVDKVTVPASVGSAPPSDADDSWHAGSSREETLVWHREPLKAGREADLRFELRGPDGRPLPIEPYMGMQGHAVITREDGAVFVHLHPMGSINMAAQQLFEREAGIAGMDHSAHTPRTSHGAQAAPSPSPRVSPAGTVPDLGAGQERRGGADGGVRRGGGGAGLSPPHLPCRSHPGRQHRRRPVDLLGEAFEDSRHHGDLLRRPPATCAARWPRARRAGSSRRSRCRSRGRRSGGGTRGGAGRPSLRVEGALGLHQDGVELLCPSRRGQRAAGRAPSDQALS